MNHSCDDAATPAKKTKVAEDNPVLDAGLETDNEAAQPSTPQVGPDSKSVKKKKNRCWSCHKKLGLTAFPCRCEQIFCPIHRYSDEHNCPFDYRQLGAAEISKNNPLIVAEKVEKI